ncbi:MAG: hypothetical protein WCJ93_11770 [Methanomicrobiales archaeon]
MSSQPKYNVSDVITNIDGGPCYGYFIEANHWDGDYYILYNLTRCAKINNSQWEYVKAGGRKVSYDMVELNPQIVKIDHIEHGVLSIPGPRPTWH